MNKITSILMYLLWTAAIVAVLVTTFTNFQYIDLNALAGVLLLFATINTFLIVAKNSKT